jgi:hypothetical protein
LFMSCKKLTYDDAIPKVTIVSASFYSLDSVILHGKITTRGASAIEYTGFAFDTHPNLSLLKNQVLLKNGSTDFSAIVHAYHDTTYYFKAFAANSFGYSSSNVIQFKVPAPAPVVAPCTLTNNYITDNGVGQTATAIGSASNPSYGNYAVDIYESSEDVYVFFPYVPINGIYTTTSDGYNIGHGQVYIYINNFNLYSINSGGKVYVSINNGITTVSFCSLNYSIGNYNATISGKVTY